MVDKISEIKFINDRNVLDLGCGMGYLSLVLAFEMGLNVIAIGNTMSILNT